LFCVEEQKLLKIYPMVFEVDFQLIHQLVDFLHTELLGWC
jgi:hypothetical protein